MIGTRRSSFITYRGTSLGFYLAALILFSAACGFRASHPEPQMFAAPAHDVRTFTEYLKEGCHFGGTLDMESDTLVVGAPCWAYPWGARAGTVYILQRASSGELEMEAALVSSDRGDGFQYDQQFGSAVALNGDLLAIGAPGYDDRVAGENTGAVYIFQQVGGAWVETDRLTSRSPILGAKLGTAISFNGEWLAASGSPHAEAVTIFHREANGWSEMSQIRIPPTIDDKPLYALPALYGDTLAISTVAGSSEDEEADLSKLTRMGTVTLYERDGDEWVQTFKTRPQEAALYRMYGEGPYGLPVALGGEDDKATLLAVGKPGFALDRNFRGAAGNRDTPKNLRGTGSVAIFARGENGWYQEAELMLASGVPVPGGAPFFGTDPGPIFFGAFVLIEGNRLAVVSTFTNAAYVFARERGEWKYTHRLAPVAEGNHDDFQRRTVALSGDRLLMGSPGEIGGGAVHVFELPSTEE